MKIVKVVVFKDDKECSLFSDQVFESLKNIEPDKEFCGIWGEIQYNSEEVINSISSCVNHFIQSQKNEIIFGCCEKDYNDIMAKLNISGCSIKKLDHTFNTI